MVKPLLDVTEVLLDPMFADEFQVIRRTQKVDSHGEPQVDTTTVYTKRQGCVGVVTPTGDNSLVRADAYEAQSNALQVITKFRLQGAAKTGKPLPVQYLPDLVRWQHGCYVVRSTNDFTRFGAGFTVAECLLTDYIPEKIAEDQCHDK